MNIFKKVYEAVINALFPDKCAGCGEIIETGEGFCDYCLEMLPETAVDRLCRVCGCEKKQCQCKYTVFHFTSAAAPYYNDGPAKRAMYAFKFREKLHFADFFARKMALCVKNRFYDVEFNAVAYVPLPFKRELKRGYNQSRELAVRIAKILGLPVAENALGCNTKKKLQHKTSIKDRFKNVKGMYYPNISLKGRTVLLVDDIKTTGATLDECAKALFKASANDVYCITALTTKRKKEGR